MQIRVQPTWADAWVGVYWKRVKNGHIGAVFTWDNITRENVIEHTVYICLVPFLPIVLRWYRPWNRAVQPTEACSYCGGSRYVDREPPATGFIRCPRCNGTGLADQPAEEK